MRRRPGLSQILPASGPRSGPHEEAPQVTAGRGDARSVCHRDMPAVVLVPLASLHAAETPQPPGKPNVVLLPVDDSDYGDVACDGNPHVKTPNIDAFAGQATEFMQFHVSPTCPCPNAHGLPVGSLRLQLPPQPNLPLPECPRLARGIVTLHARGGPLPSTKREPPTGKRWASPRRSRHGRL